jgi:LPS O-antigen subunit length determinant protein (WzzB/FepE family)
MKKNNPYITDDEIDIVDLIRTLWREKILIFSSSLIFMAIGYVYGALQPKIYKTEIILHATPLSLFEVYQPFFSKQQQQQQQQQQQGLVGQFNNNLKLNLLSLDTLVQFVEKNNTINDFKNYLKEKNISARSYFKGKISLEIDKKNNVENKYSLIYSEPLPGETFLNDYIIFAQQQTLIMLKQELNKKILNEINIYQQHLKIAQKINLEDPILNSIRSGTAVNESDLLYYRGTKVLSQQILYLTNLLNESKNLMLDYNLILEQVSSKTLITKSPKTYAFYAFLLGIILSMFIIFLRRVL